MQTFSCGFYWFYWDFYKDKEVFVNLYTQVFGDHLQHRPKDLFVTKKFATYKQEILHHLSKRQYRKCLAKAEEYSTSVIVKMLQANDLNELYHFGIPSKTPISIDHIMSIILYCDMDRYSTKFSESFRKVNPYDNIHTVKARNSRLWWQSKLFKETIEYYGKCPYTNADNKGTYFTGVSCVLPITQYDIRLYAPTSTTPQLSVASNFANDYGMIISFSNAQDSAHLLTFFDCSWISHYPDEDERVFVHGYFPIQVESVRIVENNHLYTSILAALFVLDLTFSNSETPDMIMNTNMDIIDELFANEGILNLEDAYFLTAEQKSTFIDLVKSGYTEKEAFQAIYLSQEQNNPSNDAYVKDMFTQYVRQKKKIDITLRSISLALSNKHRSRIFSDSFPAGFTIYDKKNIIPFNIPSRTNLLSSNIFKYFPNVKEITIETNFSDDYCLPFNLLYFLENISTAAKWKQIVITDWTFEKNMDKLWNHIGGWIANLWRYSSIEIKKAYRIKGLTIKFIKTTQKPDEESTIFYHRLIITRL